MSSTVVTDYGSEGGSELLPELSGVELAMSLSPKHQGHQVLSHLQQLHHSTPFSVTDILSPIEESYRKLELSGNNPPSPYRSVPIDICLSLTVVCKKILS